MALSTQLNAQQLNNSFTLKQALAEADQTYPALNGREAAIGEYQIRKQEAQSRLLPQMQLQLQNSYGTYQGSSGAFFPVPGVFNVTGNTIAGANEVKATSNTFGSVIMDWKFFEFGKQRKTIDAAEYQLQGAKSSYDAERVALHAKVTRLYLDIPYSYASLNWAKHNVKRVKQILDLTVSLARAGLKSGADTSIASSAYSQALVVEQEWQGKLQASKINFTEVVPFQQSAISASTFIPGNTLENYNQPELTADTVVQSHPYLQVLDKQIAYEKTQQAIASRKIFPSLSVLGGLSARSSGINPDGTVQGGIVSGYHNYANNYLVGIGLSWNISGAYTSTLEKRRARKVVQGALAKYNLQKLQMNTSLQALSARITQQEKLLLESGKAFKKATQAYELYLSRYEGGLINLTELLQIQSLLQSAENIQIQAGQTFWNLLAAQAELSGDFSFLISQFNEVL